MARPHSRGAWRRIRINTKRRIAEIGVASSPQFALVPFSVRNTSVQTGTVLQVYEQLEPFSSMPVVIVSAAFCSNDCKRHPTTKGNDRRTTVLASHALTTATCTFQTEMPRNSSGLRRSSYLI